MNTFVDEFAPEKFTQVHLEEAASTDKITDNPNPRLSWRLSISSR